MKEELFEFFILSGVLHWKNSSFLFSNAGHHRQVKPDQCFLHFVSYRNQDSFHVVPCLKAIVKMIVALFNHEMLVHDWS